MKSSPRKLMLRAPNWVGDVVMSLPALQQLRKALPETEIVVVARNWVADLYAALGGTALANRVLAHDPNDGRGALVRQLRAERFDAALLLPNSLDAAWGAWRAGIPQRWGYARDGRSPLLTRAIPVPRAGEIPSHQSYYYLELLRRLGAVESFPMVSGFVVGSAIPHPPSPTPRVGLNPGAAYGTAKRWLPARYVELGRRLRDERGAEIVLFGAASERELAEQIATGIGLGARSLAGQTTLVEFVKLAADCHLFVTNDTGTMHVAAAMGVPVLAIFGPTDERATAPLGPCVLLIKKAVPCSPCLLRHCPVDHRCMREIPVSEVFETACQILNAVRPSSSTVTAR